MKPSAFAPLPVTDAEALIETVRRFEPDWLLPLPYVAESNRAGWLAVLALASEVIGVPGRASNAMLAQIRLQWWRETLDEISARRTVRNHPIARSLHASCRGADKVMAQLGSMIDAMLPFLEPGEDKSLEEALASRRPVYGAMDGALGLLAKTGEGREGIVLHALCRSAPDAEAAPSEDGTELPARRFARALARDNATLEPALADAVERYRASALERGALSALPLRLFRSERGRIVRIRNPFVQRAAILRGVLSGRA